MMKGAEMSMVRTHLSIGGMTCVNCQNKIEGKLRGTDGIASASVSYTSGTADISYDEDAITLPEIVSIIEGLDYSARPAAEKTESPKGMGNAGLLIIVAAIFMLARNFGFVNFFNAFPLD
jgi:copper chaperone CopZ